MTDEEILDYERELWVGPADAYDRKVADDVVMALPATPYLFDADAAREAVKHTPRWEEATFEEPRIHRPADGLIVLAYRVEAHKGGQAYEALCTSTLLKRDEGWVVIQHQQTPLGIEVAEKE